MSKNPFPLAQPCAGSAEVVGLHAALGLLLKATELSHALGCPVADLALPRTTLEKVGLSEAHRRVLLEAGHVEEIRATRCHRSSRGRRGIPEGACLVLTARGATFAAQVLTPGPLPAAQISPRPRWDTLTRELWWQGRLVKCYHRAAPNQERLLAAFEEHEWVRRIPDPLPHEAGVDAAVQLRETIKSLHRGQAPLRLRFHADSDGTAVRWEPALV
jgi:hypothetical protein